MNAVKCSIAGRVVPFARGLLGHALAVLALASCSSPEQGVDSSSQSLTDCAALPEWTVKTYQGGDKVRHVGHAYQCKPAPYSGWCGQSGYEPGVSQYWSQAWIDLDTCSSGSAGSGGGASSPPAAATCDSAECCTAGTPLVLTQGPDQKLVTAANSCVVALGGSDNIQCSSLGCVVLGGPGSDVIMAGDAASVRGGDGDDVINIHAGGVALGNAGNDDISAGNGDNFVYPGAGADRVTGGSGNDKVVIYDLCEVVSGERLDGGAGTDTLVTPVSLSELRSRGVTVIGFENIVVQANACKSDCTSKPACGAHGACVEGTAPGTTACGCNPGYSGENCEKFCASNRDTDQDGVLDCYDECPLHATKAKPGLCGCAVADTDTDQDGTPDCRDRCPEDPAHLAPGACGCLGEPTLKPAGTPCGVAFCPGQSSATCTAAGVCGDPNACKPEPICKLLETPASNYFICTNRSWPDAAQSCAAQGMRLARIDTYDENERLRGLMPTPAWIGGNSRAAAGVWRWAEAPSGAGEQFWSGGEQGAAVGELFAFWSAHKPSSERCLALDPKDGRWIDRGCDAALPYVCEHVPAARIGATPKLALAPQPEPLVCPPPVSGLPVEPLSEADMIAHSKDADNGNFHGAAANPPAKGSAPCPPEPESSSCPFSITIPDVECASDAACNALQPGYVCRIVDDDPTCKGHFLPCTAHARCGKLTCLQDGASDCQQVDICGDEAATTYQTVIDPGSSLGSESPKPASFFSTQPSFENSSGWADAADAPLTDGVKHAWCKLKPQDTKKVQPANLQSTKNGKSGAGSPIDFNFDPNLRFEATPNPLAFGESNLKLLARASLESGVTLRNFLSMPEWQQSIISASAEVAAERCRIKTSDSRIRLFGFDLTDQLPESLSFDTDELELADGSRPGRACGHALLRFQEAADRVKKAFYDSQQVLARYHELKKGNLGLRGDLCQKLGITNELLSGFPGGNVCPDGEPIELTIDRLLWYYQGGDGSGQVDGMADAAAGLSGATGQLLQVIKAASGSLTNAATFELPLTLPSHTETQNLFTGQFSVGPVPVRIEVDVAASYGLNGSIDFGVNFPTSLNGSRGDMSNPDSPQPSSLAYGRVTVEPYAAAGLKLYAAIGVSVVNGGVEGSISLARVRAPFRAGVGLAVASVGDTRSPPTSITDLALKGGSIEDAMPFGKGRAYRFYLTHDYGASIVLEELLSGTVNAKVRVRFAFFSRTWRKRIFSFKGLDPITLPLLEGSGRAELFTIGDSRIKNSSDLSRLGLSEDQVPVMLLEPLELPRGDALPPAGEGDFVAGELGRPFYDDLCCSAKDQPCGTVDTPSCCGGLSCDSEPGTRGTCQQCRGVGDSCDATSPCCGDNDCTAGKCQACAPVGQRCTQSSDCCDGNGCGSSGRCTGGT